MTIKAGDVVRIKDPSRYIVEFAKKIRDRDAIVLWVGPTDKGMFQNRTKVEFQQRNGRGKKFTGVIRTEDFVLKDAP